MNGAFCNSSVVAWHAIVLANCVQWCPKICFPKRTRTSPKTCGTKTAHSKGLGWELFQIENIAVTPQKRETVLYKYFSGFLIVYLFEGYYKEVYHFTCVTWSEADPVGNFQHIYSSILETVPVGPLVLDETGNQSFPFNQATTNIKLGIQLPINENAGSLPSAMGLPSHAAVNSVSLSQKKLSEDRSESHQILLEGDLLWFHCDFMRPFITPTWDTRSPGDLDAAGQETSSFLATLATVVPTSCPNGAALSLQDTLHGFDWICMEAFMKFSFNGFSGRFWVSFWESLDNADLGWRRTGCIPKKSSLKSSLSLVPFCWCFAFFRCFPCHHSRSRLDNQRISEILHKFWTRWDSTIDGYRPPGPVSKGKFTEESIVGSKKIEFTSSHPSNIKYTP